MFLSLYFSIYTGQFYSICRIDAESNIEIGEENTKIFCREEKWFFLIDVDSSTWKPHMRSQFFVDLYRCMGWSGNEKPTGDQIHSFIMCELLFGSNGVIVVYILQTLIFNVKWQLCKQNCRFVLIASDEFRIICSAQTI